MRWHHIRHDFAHSGSSTGGNTYALSAVASRETSGRLRIPPYKTFWWDHANQGWVEHAKANFTAYTIDCSDAEMPITIQVDTSSSDNSVVSLNSTFVNGNTNLDINIAAIPAAMSTTANLGGRSDTTSGSYYEWTGIVDGIRKTVGMTMAPPAFRVYADANTTKFTSATVVVSFKRATL